MATTKSKYVIIIFAFVVVFLQAPSSFATKFNDTLNKAQMGDFNAQSYVGHSYLCGINVEKDDARARFWYKKVIEHPNADAKIVAHASLILGTMYSTGAGGKKCYLTALKYLKTAAKQGFSDAHIFLGHMYAKGQGVSRNYKKALNWWQQADELGHPAAAKYIAELKLKMKTHKG